MNVRDEILERLDNCESELAEIKDRLQPKEEPAPNTSCDWQRLSPTTHRMRVPNGWLVRTEAGNGGAASVALIFIEDKYQQW